MAKKERSLVGSMRRADAALSGLLAALLVVWLTFAAPYLSADQKGKKEKQEKAHQKGRLAATELSEDEAILHALNRLGFGPRPGDVGRVRQMGLEKWIEQQLNPDAIPDAGVAARLERFPTLAMSPAKLLEEFPTPQIAARQAGMTLEEYRKQREEQARYAGQERQSAAAGREQGAMDERGAPRRRPLLGGDPNMVPARLEDVRAPQRIIAELSMAKLTRAVYSERQLYEQMVDFWFNHFNVFANKGADRWLLTSYERDVIRPHAMGKFRDLLSATAKSPAMLFYLDNWMSADPKSFERMERELSERRQRFLSLFGGFNPRAFGRGPQRGRLGRQWPPVQGQSQPLPPPQQRQRRGLNENYARELMELHTLGVDGGYTQQDVIEVARCFTGWTLRAPRRDLEFYFEERIHDPDAKTVLGKKIHAGGMKDGEEVLAILARHPSTAKFISTKLARRFVADNPPPALVERMAKTFLETDGDIRAVLRTMIDSSEFWSRQAYRAKIKRPFELVASAARAVGADLEVALPLVLWIARIGEPLYLCQPPTGYSDKAEVWVNSGALLNRLNFALALSGNRLRGARTDLAGLFGPEATSDPQKALGRALELFLTGQVSPQTRAILEKQLSDPQILQATLDDPVKQVDIGVIAGLVLGSPEFQRR